MIETIIKNYLDMVQTLPVLFEKQPGMEEFYIIEKTGGSEENHIRTAMLAIQSYAGSKARAAQINEYLIRLMLDAVMINEVSSVELNSNYDFTDTTTKQYRYQAVFDIVYFD